MKLTRSAATGLATTLLAVACTSCLSPATRPTTNAHEARREARESPDESAYWDWRVSYPTGRYSASWYDQATAQNERLTKSTPDNGHRKSLGVLDPLRATALGPSPLDWTSTYGLVAGRVNVIVSHPTRSNIAWFGSDGGGVWKTSNCCGPDTHWSPKTDMPQIANIAIGTIALDPNNPDVLYAGTGDFRRNRPFSFGAGGLLASSDGGESWRVLGQSVFNPTYTEAAGSFAQYRAISTVAVDPNNSANLIVGTNQGLYLSYDQGLNWSGPCFTNRFDTQRQDITGLLAIRRGASTDLIVAVGAIGKNSSVRSDLRLNGANGIYFTTLATSGCPAAWNLISRVDNGWPDGSGSGIPLASPGGNPLRRIDLAVAPGNPNVIYAQVMQLGVWRSLDGGSSWTQRAIRAADFSTGCVSDPLGNGLGAEDYNAGISVSPADPQTVYLSSTDTWRSTDGADTFTNLTCGYDELSRGRPGYVHVDQHARAYVGGDGQHLLIGTDGGIYSTSNAQAAHPDFTAINGGASTIEFYSGDITPGFNDSAVSTRSIVGGAQDNGSSNVTWSGGVQPAVAQWRVRSQGDGINAMIEPMLRQRWYYSSQFGYILASVSGPNVDSSVEISPQNDWLGDRRGFLMPYTLYKYGDESTCPAATGCKRMLVGTFRVWESLLGGIPSTSWYVNSPDLTKALDTTNDLSVINKVEHARTDASIAIVGTNDGNVWYGFGLGRGQANSASWVNVTDGNTALPNRAVMDVATDPSSALTAYAALAGFDQNTPTTPGHVFRVSCSANCSQFHWDNKSGNLPNIPVNAIAINPNLPRQAFAGTDWGLYYSDDITATNPVWKRFDGGLPSAMVWDLVIDRGNTTLAIFTRSRGAYVFPLPTASLGSYRISGDATGSFYNPAQSGHGWFIEAVPNNGGTDVLAAWYTYQNGEPRWLFGNAPVDGNRVTIPLYTGRNTDFPPRFDEQQVRVEPWGNVELTFDSANDFTAHWTPNYPGYTEGSLAFTRLSTVAPADGLSPAHRITSCYTGAWYNTAQAGHGFTVEVLAGNTTGQMQAAWYVYLNGQSYWLIGQGPIVGDTATLDMLSVTGGKFPPNFNAANIVRHPWGTLHFRAIDGNHAHIDWTSTQPGFSNSELDLTRLTNTLGRECPP